MTRARATLVLTGQVLVAAGGGGLQTDPGRRARGGALLTGVQEIERTRGFVTA